MKKQLLVSTFTLLIITATGSAATAGNAFKNELKGIGSQVSQDAKAIVKDIKTGVKQDLDNTTTSVKKSKVEELKKQKDTKLKFIDDEITAKKNEIIAVKKANILETERTARLSILSRELKYLETKRANIEKTFNNKINALTK